MSAVVAARAQGSRVEVESERTEATTTWVNPDGTWTTESHAGPVRFRDKAGQWKDVDLTLEAGADGAVGPRGHAYGLRLGGRSAAGATESDIATAEHGAGREVSLAWPGALPAPSLSGTRATYRGVKRHGFAAAPD